MNSKQDKNKAKTDLIAFPSISSLTSDALTPLGKYWILPASRDSQRGESFALVNDLHLTLERDEC